MIAKTENINVKEIKQKISKKDKKPSTSEVNKNLKKHNLVWRPTKYKKQYAYEMIEWFTKRAEDLYYDRVKKSKSFSSDKWESKEVEYVIFAKDVPTFEEYAEKIQISDHTLSDWTLVKYPDWSLKHPEFLHSYTRCKQIQRRFLLINWLNWTFQSNIAQFLLINHYPNLYKDKKELDIWWQKDNPVKITTNPEDLTDDQLDDVITGMLSK